MVLVFGMMVVGCDNNSTDVSNTENIGGKTGEKTFSPPTKAQVEAFVEKYRKDTTLMGGSAAVYIRSIAVNTYTVEGKNIGTNPSPVPESAQAEVKFTVRTILSFNGLSIGERLNVDNFRVDLQSDLKDWLVNQGFGYSNVKVTTGNTTFG